MSLSPDAAAFFARLASEAAERDARIADLAVPPRPLMLSHRNPMVPSTMLVHPDVRRMPHWRVTYVGVDGMPTGHVEVDGGAADALLEAWRLGGDVDTVREPRDPG